MMSEGLNNKLEKLRSGKLQEAERKKLLAVFHVEGMEYDLKKELFSQLEKTEDVNEDSKQVQRDFDKLWGKIESTKKSEKKNFTINLASALKLAAVLVIGFIVGNILQLDFNGEEDTTYFTAIAPKGSISETILPDGTLIYLNAGSEIKYTVGKETNKREVYLKGEAWFDVEKSKEVPFIVHTSFYDVKVMGTEFNVRAYPEDVNVVTTLEEGEIRIQSTEQFKIEDEITLVPGEQLIYSKEKKSLAVNKVRTENYSSWKNNKLIFINMSLEELIVLLERKYGIEIVVPDKSILNYHYDGTIKNETIIEVLNILQKTLPLHYVVRGQEVVIYKN
ncbi:FecR family protein [Sunxiuqinia sp. A32]|uniref:FecR family protein n=1 Tax=Sunxiuqinia sp. A32 TaxID=3461496 RepID=UPI0040466D6B